MFVPVLIALLCVSSLSTISAANTAAVVLKKDAEHTPPEVKGVVGVRQGLNGFVAVSAAAESTSNLRASQPGKGHRSNGWLQLTEFWYSGGCNSPYSNAWSWKSAISVPLGACVIDPFNNVTNNYARVVVTDDGSGNPNGRIRGQLKLYSDKECTQHTSIHDWNAPNGCDPTNTFSVNITAERIHHEFGYISKVRTQPNCPSIPATTYYRGGGACINDANGNSRNVYCSSYGPSSEYFYTGPGCNYMNYQGWDYFNPVPTCDAQSNMDGEFSVENLCGGGNVPTIAPVPYPTYNAVN